MRGHAHPTSPTRTRTQTCASTPHILHEYTRTHTHTHTHTGAYMQCRYKYAYSQHTISLEKKELLLSGHTAPSSCRIRRGTSGSIGPCASAGICEGHTYTHTHNAVSTYTHTHTHIHTFIHTYEKKERELSERGRVDATWRYWSAMGCCSLLHSVLMEHSSLSGADPGQACTLYILYI